MQLGDFPYAAKTFWSETPVSPLSTDGWWVLLRYRNAATTAARMALIPRIKGRRERGDRCWFLLCREAIKKGSLVRRIALHEQKPMHAYTLKTHRIMTRQNDGEKRLFIT